MKHDLTTGTWKDNTGCPISIILATTSDGDGYGIIKAQPMTYTELQRGKSTTSCTQRIIDAQGRQHPTI